MNYSCDECGYTTLRRYNLERHIATVHSSPPGNIVAAQATETNETPRNEITTTIVNAVSSAIGEHPITPELLNRIVATVTIAITNTLATTNVSENQCSICHKVLCSKKSLRQHTIICSNKTLSYQCPTCNQKFASRAALYRHKKSCPPS